MPKSKVMCSGCRDDFYNHNRPEGCWSFRKATIVKRVQVGTWEPPPYARERARKFLSCFHLQGSSMLELSDCRVKPRAAIQKERERVTPWAECGNGSSIARA